MFISLKAVMEQSEQPPTGPALLIDARNAMYRAVYAGMADKSDRVKYHYFVIFLRQFAAWINKKRPSSIHVFWDAPRETVWRRQVLPTYKDRSTSNYVEGLAENLAHTTAVAQDFFKYMGVRQYSKKEMEADDLIYAAVSVMHPRKTYIVSNDSDMTQIPFRFNSCTVYKPDGLSGSDVETPNINPAHLKALVGDKSDAIPGYNQIGPVKGTAMLRDFAALDEFLKLKGQHTYRRNLILIDLSLCPRLLANTCYIQRTLAEPVVWDKGEVMKLIMQHKVNGLQQEFNDLVVPFKNLV